MRAENILKFLEENKHISINKVEKDLNLPARTIRLDRSRDISQGNVDLIEEYLCINYDYDDNHTVLIDHSDNSEPAKEATITKKVYNVGRIPGFDDRLLRFQDPDNGLWKRINQWGMAKDEEGNPVIADRFKPINDDTQTDNIGTFYISKCGIKVYSAYNKPATINKVKTERKVAL